MAQSRSRLRSNDPGDMANIDDVCMDWAREKYGSKYKVVSVDTKDLKVIKRNINYIGGERKENQSVKRSARTFVNRLDIPVEQEFSEQSTKKYTCVWTKTKGLQLSGGLSVTVGLPAALGLSAKVGGQLNLSDTETTTSGTDETLGQVTRLQQPPRSTLVAEIITTEKVVTMPYSLSYRLQGKISFDLKKLKGWRRRKTKSVDVVELYQDFGGEAVTAAEGKKGVLLTTKGTFETSIEAHQVVEIKEQNAEKVMKMIHKDLLNDNREKIAEEVSDKQALSKLLEAMTTEKRISEEQFNSVSQKSSVKEGVDELVNVLENAEHETFLVFLDILQREGYSELVELLDPRGMYPDSVRQISNRSGVVDHYFVTKKEREVKDCLESGRGAILHGMPGSGKTQLAYKVAGEYAKVHPHSVVWVIDGSEEKKLNDGITNLQQSLSGKTSVDISQFQSIVSRWKHSLLLINDLSPHVAIPTQVLGSSRSAKMIVTTQDSFRELVGFANIPIEGFTEDEAVEFLSPKMPPRTTEEQMIDLANIFSRLPLGLAAARASIHRDKMTVEEYKQRLYAGKEALKRLMDTEDDWFKTYCKDEHHQETARNIFAALQLAIDKLDDSRTDDPEEKMCKVMLQPCAFLDLNNIPVLMLKSALKSSPTIGTDADFTGRMRMYSLGNIEGAGVKRRLSIHSVTQMALRLHMDKQQQTTWINKVLQILVKFFVKDMTYSEMHKFSVSLMPHVEAALKHADKLKLGAGDKLKLGAEYPLMKARLLMVYGHLLIQKGTPGLSTKCLKEAKESLLQFADMLSAKSVERNPDYHITSKDLYQSLANKSQSLKDDTFKETVIRRAITRQNLRAVSDELGAEHSTTRKLENMVDNFEPLTMEMYKTLVDSNLAIPVEKLKRNFLPELYISILFTLNKALFDAWDGYSTSIGFVSWDRLIILALDMCTEVTNETGVLVLVRFLADSVSLSSVKVTDMVMSHLHVQGNKELFKDKGIATEDIMTSILLKVVETLSLHETKGATRSYDFGLLSGDGDTLLKLNYYENVMLCCVQAIQQAEEGTKLTPIITWGQDTCKEMLELVESESQAGNPPHKRAEYYMTAGLFNVAVRELEKAAEMFRKAYKVELEREEYHGRMGDALRCLIQVRIAQKELRKARVSVRRLLQLSKDHWHEKVPYAEEELRMVRCRIAFQAIKENMEKGKAVCE